MQSFTQKISLVWKDGVLRKRLLFVAGALIVFRFLSVIPIPGIDATRLEAFFSGNQFFGLLDIFSGGGLSNLSIVMLGVGPYITASIIMQLLTMMFPKLKAMYQEDGEAGRAKFAQYSRLLTIPLALIQSFGFLVLLKQQGVVPDLPFIGILTNVIIISAGSVLLMWVGELMTEFGIGNGTSLIIFAGIVASLPQSISQLLFAFEPSQLPIYIATVVVATVVIYGVVVVTEAERPIPVTYAKRVRGMKVYGGVSTYLPLRVNQAGVIPIIFALSILLFPQMIATVLSAFQAPFLQRVAELLTTVFANPWIYASLYFVLVFLFTYFYTAVTFDPDTISTNLQKNGAFIPGVRPGEATSTYISQILTRITLVGAVFLALVAVLPLAMQGLTGNQALAIGGTALLIAVSVVLDFMKKIDAQISMREY
ncbi:MAG: preprotein translocase subunit SecY [Candidatus Taylorbacteria bacterium CG11_big_fil_rev_8_21_14_0_20_46_11]|uniref:Protein translocase subunit SecY n=1 Tax=Candidatus Taylorbacteria bacterium CG11_big_fil_rev_8_21_14_0_20_46_11 TaxID=1975025 RepID=A0A2H0KD11_9BACT|nr:MAG: preprotein translocase subunit SecY [Candidatus Taylorbacteria bacterium CG11_big_fil_rev_8_21_14_0_20_46_11]